MNCTYARARAGEPAAVAAIVDRLRPRLTKMAAYYGSRTGEDSDDLLQEAWTGLLEAITDLKPEGAGSESYLVARARWRLLDSVKRASLRRCLPLELEDTLAQASENGLGEVETALFACRLKSTQRAVLACLMDGLTWREAGARLGCTSANIAYHVGQIRRQFNEYAACDAGRRI